MKRLLLLTAAAGAVAAAIIVPALADDRHDHERDRMRTELRRGADDDMGPGMMKDGDMAQMMGMMKMMRMMHGGGDDMMEHGGMFAMMGGAFPLAAFDANDDGKVTPDELRTGLLGALKTHDADGDGTLSLAEFETLHAALTREHTVDRFQALDADGDGKVTADEIAAPTKRMERMMKQRDEKTPPGGG